MKKSRAFTLIELLVVILIIGILAAVAVPQYRIAVYKSQLQALAPIMKNVKEAEISYRLANGSYTRSFDQLDLDLPVSKPCSDNSSATYGNYYLKSQCRDFGNSFCVLTDADSVLCGRKNPLIRLDLYFYKRFSEGNWICWGNVNKPLTMKVCKAISNKEGDSTNGAHIFDF